MQVYQIEVIVMKKVFVVLMVILVAAFSAFLVIAESDSSNETRDSTSDVEDKEDATDEVSEEKEDEVVTDATRAVKPVLIRERSCLDRCVDAGVEKDDCRKKCDIDTHTIARRVDAKPVVIREAVADRIDGCLERCVAAGVEKDDCRKKCSPRMDDEHMSDVARAHRAFAFNKDDFTKDELRKIAQLRKDQADEVLGEDAVAARKKLARLKVRKAEDLYKKRAVAADKKAAAKRRYEAARKKHDTLEDESEDRGRAFDEVKVKLRDCGDDCDEIRAEAQARAKEYIAKSGERVLAHLEKVKSKIEGNENIDSERASEIIGKLDAAIAEVEAALVDAEAATTKEELRSAAKSISSIWKRVKHVAEAGAARVVTSRVGEIVVRSQQLEVKLEKLLAEIEERGAEVENLDVLTDKFDVLIAEARDLHKQSESLLEEVAVTRRQKRLLTDEERNQLTEMIKKAKGLSKDAQSTLKDAHGILVEIAKDLHEADASFEGAEDEDLIEDESDDDSEEDEE
jgi:hypothetical protein